ncbi:MAG: glycosyltransferase [Leptolyngbya sp. PLA1]|nr:glycosyltransferase [Leptolyngbya sp. PLA1]
MGAGLDTGAYAAALRGLAVAAGVRPDMHVFADAVAARRAGLWAAARRLGLLDRLSLIEELEGRRDLLMQADLLVLPEARGDQRSVLLEAMATGVVVVAAADPLVTTLQDGRTARLVTDHAAWGAAFTDVLTNEARTRSLALSANEYVRTNARVSDYVRGVLAAYQALAPDSALPFGNRA